MRHLFNLHAIFGMLHMGRKHVHDSRPLLGRANADGRVLFRDCALFKDGPLYEFRHHADLTVTLIDNKGRSKPTFNPTSTGLSIISSVISLDGSTVALLPAEGPLQMISFRDGAWQCVATHSAHKGAIFVWAVFLPDNRLITGDEQGVVYMFKGQDEICTHGPIHESVPFTLQSPSKSSVTRSRDGTLVARIVLLPGRSASPPDTNGYSVHFSLIQVHRDSFSHWTSVTAGPGPDQQLRRAARQNSLPLAPDTEIYSRGTGSPVWGLSSDFFGFSPNGRHVAAFVFPFFGKKGDDFRIYSWDTRACGQPSEINVPGQPFDEFVLINSSPHLALGMLERRLAKELQYPFVSKTSFCVLGAIPTDILTYFPQPLPPGSPPPPRLEDMVFVHVGPRGRFREMYQVANERSICTYHGAIWTENGERIGIDGTQVCCLSKGSFLFDLPTEYAIKHPLNSLPIRFGGSRLLLGGHAVKDGDTSDIRSLPLHIIDLSRIL